MRKRFSGICLALVITVGLIAVFLPSCAPTEGVTIDVKATLCGAPWSGNVSYTLTGPGATAPAVVNGTEVPKTFTGEAGTWACAYVSGGPDGAFLVDITPSESQVVFPNTRVAFTLNFELEQDASIDFLTWTVSGDPIGEPGEFVDYWAVPCEVIDAHFKQHVDGCEGHNVMVKETSRLTIVLSEGPPEGVWINVVNDLCAVNKTPDPVQKVSQVPSAEFGLHPWETVTLNVTTVWELVKGTDYVKSINWLGISAGWNQSEGHPCVLFELILPVPGIYAFQLHTSAEVELMDAEDANPDNDHAVSPEFLLVVEAL